MQRPAKSNVLLTELVIVILFFALTAATAMQLFVGAHLKSRHNAIAQEAAIVCQDWTEQLRGVEDIAGFLTAAGFVKGEDGMYTLLQGSVTLRAEVGEELMAVGSLHYCALSAIEEHNMGDDSKEPLSQLSVATYVPVEEVAG